MTAIKCQDCYRQGAPGRSYSQPYNVAYIWRWRTKGIPICAWHFERRLMDKLNEQLETGYLEWEE